MKSLFTVSLLAVLALCGFNSLSAQAQEARHGVVLSMEPIENRGNDESEVTQKKRGIGRALGNLAGLGLMRSNVGGTAGTIVAGSSGDIGEQVATQVGDQGPATRYMVKLQLDDGKKMSITQLRGQLEGLEVGSRVRLEGTGSSAAVYAE